MGGMAEGGDLVEKFMGQSCSLLGKSLSRNFAQLNLNCA